MAEPALQIPAESGATPASLARRTAPSAPLWKTILSPLASLRLTVVLLALAIVLVFCGTLAQRDVR